MRALVPAIVALFFAAPGAHAATQIFGVQLQNHKQGPVVGANVTLIGPAAYAKTFVTDAAGFLIVPSLPYGDYEAHVRMKGFDDFDTKFTLDASGDESWLSVRLTETDETTPISSPVLNSQTMPFTQFLASQRKYTSTRFPALVDVCNWHGQDYDESPVSFGLDTVTFNAWSIAEVRFSCGPGPDITPKVSFELIAVQGRQEFYFENGSTVPRDVVRATPTLTTIQEGVPVASVHSFDARLGQAQTFYVALPLDDVTGDSPRVNAEASDIVTSTDGQTAFVKYQMKELVTVVTLDDGTVFAGRHLLFLSGTHGFPIIAKNLFNSVVDPTALSIGLQAASLYAISLAADPTIAQHPAKALEQAFLGAGHPSGEPIQYRSGVYFRPGAKLLQALNDLGINSGSHDIGEVAISSASNWFSSLGMNLFYLLVPTNNSLTWNSKVLAGDETIEIQTRARDYGRLVTTLRPSFRGWTTGHFLDALDALVAAAPSAGATSLPQAELDAIIARATDQIIHSGN